MGPGVLLWAKDEDEKMVILLGKRSINPEKGQAIHSGRDLGPEERFA